MVVAAENPIYNCMSDSSCERETDLGYKGDCIEYLFAWLLVISTVAIGAYSNDFIFPFVL